MKALGILDGLRERVADDRALEFIARQHEHEGLEAMTSGHKERIRAAGCDGYIAKPMRYLEFVAVIEAQLART